MIALSSSVFPVNTHTYREELNGSLSSVCSNVPVYVVVTLSSPEPVITVYEAPPPAEVPVPSNVRYCVLSAAPYSFTR